MSSQIPVASGTVSFERERGVYGVEFTPGLAHVEVKVGSDSERIPLGHEHSYMQALRNPDGSPSAASQRVEARLKDLPTLHSAIVWRPGISKPLL